MLTNKLGLYIHIPFCKQKCHYCDFYSFGADAAKKREYVAVLQNRIADFGERLQVSADTIYIGGGTPTVLPGEDLASIIKTAKKHFSFSGGEITVEVNPADNLKETFIALKAAGVNRISLGVQSANKNELKALGRRHTNADVMRCVKDARDCGIDNISLDLMLGIPHQTSESLHKTLNFMNELEPQHISAYILKVEPGTPFGKMDLKDLMLPKDDNVSELYLQACEFLKNAEYEHYEISNFAKKGCRSRHNMKYWLGEPYLGIGPAAHSFLDGKRFFYERDINSFVNGAEPKSDGTGGGKQEFIMLRLRLSDGLNIAEYEEKFGEKLNVNPNKLKMLADAGYIVCKGGTVCLTEKGFLVSNLILQEFI